jgi:hypothetical protein
MTLDELTQVEALRWIAGALSRQNELLADLGEAQRRIAAADERRNELLEGDQQERREAWGRELSQRAELMEAMRHPEVEWRPGPADFARDPAEGDR